MLRIINDFISFVRINHSPSYAMKVANNFWSNTLVTHGSMDDSQFNFFFNHLKDIIVLNPKLTYLDFGGGNGEIASKFNNEGYSFDHCDISKEMVKNAMNTYNLNSCECKNLDNNKKYDAILIHNVIFYIHPKLLNQHLLSLNKLLNAKGKIYITDTPDYDKRHICFKNLIKTTLTK